VWRPRVSINQAARRPGVAWKPLDLCTLKYPLKSCCQETWGCQETRDCPETERNMYPEHIMPGCQETQRAWKSMDLCTLSTKEHSIYNKYINDPQTSQKYSFPRRPQNHEIHETSSELLIFLLQEHAGQLFIHHKHLLLS